MEEQLDDLGMRKESELPEVLSLKSRQSGVGQKLILVD